MLHEIDAGDLIDFARRWADLGDAVADQVSQVVDDPPAAAGLRRADLEVNPNAIELARERLGGLNERECFILHLLRPLALYGSTLGGKPRGRVLRRGSARGRPRDAP
jgi:hypothetical protein